MSECMARVFAIRVQLLLRAGVIAVQAEWRPLLIPGAEVCPKPLAQCRGATRSEPVTVMVQN